MVSNFYLRLLEYQHSNNLTKFCFGHKERDREREREREMR